MKRKKQKKCSPFGLDRKKNREKNKGREGKNTPPPHHTTDATLSPPLSNPTASSSFDPPSLFTITTTQMFIMTEVAMQLFQESPVAFGKVRASEENLLEQAFFPFSLVAFCARIYTPLVNQSLTRVRFPTSPSSLLPLHPRRT